MPSNLIPEFAVSFYVDLIGSFKKNSLARSVANKEKLSELITWVNNRILAFINSPHFNSDIKHFENMNAEGPPFTDYELDPANVSQIKKLINALYYARITFENLESFSTNKDNLQLLTAIYISYTQTIDSAYQACYLATNLDVNVQDMFRHELDILFQAMNQIGTLIDNNTEQGKKFVEQVKEYPLSYKVGEVTGIAVEQMSPSSGNRDYDLITQFSAVLPSYIDNVNQYLKRYTSQVPDEASTLKDAKLEELQKTALTLLNDIETVKSSGNNVFTSLPFLKYFQIIRNIIILTKQSMEQMHYTADSLQEVMQENIAKLKYVVFPQLFALVDKVEVNCMLKPGTLSAPLMAKARPLYQTLITHASKVVDFKQKGAELLTIEDSRFLNLRLEWAYQHIDEANKALFYVQQTQAAAERFFGLLATPGFQALRLYQLPQEVKTQLIEDYKILKPYMVKLNAELHELIIEGLHYDSEHWLDSMVRAIPLLNTTTNHVSSVLAMQTAVEQAINKEENTHEFQITRYEQLINSVTKETHLNLYPYGEAACVFTSIESEDKTPAVNAGGTESIFLIDEAAILKTRQGMNNVKLKFHKDQDNQYLMNAKDLKASQASSLYQWYNKKHQDLSEAEKAFIKLMQILEQQANSTSIAGVKLNLGLLSDTAKLECHALYHTLKPYLLDCVPAERKPALLKFCLFLEQGFDPKAAKPEPQINILEQLKEPLEALFAETKNNWDKRKQIYHKWTQKLIFREESNVFLIDEAYLLQKSGHSIGTIQFKEIDDHKTVANMDELSSTQAISLYQAYRNKQDKFVVAKKAYNQFMLIIDKYLHSAELATKKLHLSQFNKHDKQVCAKLYTLFQPYFIHGIPKEMRATALAFDKMMVKCFTENTSYNTSPAIDNFKSLDAYFTEHFTTVDLAWKKRANQFLVFAQEQSSKEHKAAPLEKDKKSDARAHYLLKTKDASKHIAELRNTLLQLGSNLNGPLQILLKPQKNGLPFPEIENTQLVLGQSKQLLAIKQLFNAIYHVEKIFKQLEQLNSKSFKSTYVFHLIKIYIELKKLIAFNQGLMQDPHFSFLGQDLSDKLQLLRASLLENTEAYQVAPEEVGDEKAVKYSGLWYSLNSFFVIPKHIRNLTNNSYLSPEELNALHLRAMRANNNIEAIINSSHSYFRLFLQIPKMHNLYTTLTTNLNEFLVTSHDTVLHNLDKIQAEVFAPMLLEADNWENNLGLKPGTLSDAMKLLLDEYFKGLLHPLNLPSAMHIKLLCEDPILTKRIETLEANLAHEKQLVKEIDTTYQPLKALYKALENYEMQTTRLLPPKPEVINAAKNHLIAVYKEALPKLLMAKEELAYHPRPSTDAKSLAFDNLLNDALSAQEPRLTQVRTLIKDSYYYYLGLSNTHNLQVLTLEEKLAFLEKQKNQQVQINQDLVNNFTQEAFDKQCEMQINCHPGLQHMDKEYKGKLKDYLHTFKDSVIDNARDAQDIHATVKTLLQEHTQKFEELNIQAYKRLDTIMAALFQFKGYFKHARDSIEKNCAYIENKETLGPKAAAINQLIHCAENSKLSAMARVNAIKKEVENPNFKRIVTTHQAKMYRQGNPATIDYLKSFLLYLLNSLSAALGIIGIHTHSKKHFEALKDVTTDPLKHKTAMQRLGLFTYKKDAETNTTNSRPDEDSLAPSA